MKKFLTLSALTITLLSTNVMAHNNNCNGNWGKISQCTDAGYVSDSELYSYQQQQSHKDASQDVAINTNSNVARLALNVAAESYVNTVHNTVAIGNEVGDRIEGDKQTLKQAKSYADEGDSQTLLLAEDYTRAQDVITLNAAQSYSDQQLGSYAKQQATIDSRQDIAIAGLNNRVGVLENRMDHIEHDVQALKGMVAANIAANTVYLPRKFNGNIAVGVGVGYYDGYNGLAIGVVHDHGDWATKVTVGGSDADNWSNLAFGGSVNWVF